MYNIKNTSLKLEDYVFGFADSETEYTRNPDIFKNAFYDPKKIVEKLIYGHEFMLIGRKGVGKTAFSAKIRSLAEADNELFADLITLSNFEFDDFNKLGNNSLTGTQKFKSIWDLTLLIQVFKVLNKKHNFSEVEQFNNVIEYLDKNGLLIGKDINSIVRKMSKQNFKFTTKLFEVSSEYGLADTSYSKTELVEFFIESLTNIEFNGVRQLIIIDGLDDILRYEDDKLLILSGLIRSVNEINMRFYRENTPIKIIMLARQDILASITDPDFNKIRRDAGIVINWDNGNDDLKNLVNLRFKISGVDDDVNSHWNKIFPPKINNKSSWYHILEYTLNKPRDILQFLTQCQKTFPNKNFLRYSEVDTVLRDYSTEYFIEEMKNELTGFIDDEAIKALPIIMQKLGGSDFTYDQFKTISLQELPGKEDEYFKQLVLLLFDNGYLGQVTPIKKYDHIRKKEIKCNQAIFKHKKPTAKIDYTYSYSIHKGLYKALNIVKK